MNAREKKLIFVLIGAALLIVNVFLFTSYKTSMKVKRSQLSMGAKQLNEMQAELSAGESQREDAKWLEENAPAEGNHGKVGAELATYTEESAERFQVDIKVRPSPQPEDMDETGVYRSAKVKVVANTTDEKLYQWLTDLQDPKKSRGITLLRISPQRDAPDRVDCVLEVTQWFAPETEGSEALSE